MTVRKTFFVSLILSIIAVGLSSTKVAAIAEVDGFDEWSVTSVVWNDTAGVCTVTFGGVKVRYTSYDTVVRYDDWFSPIQYADVYRTAIYIDDVRVYNSGSKNDVKTKVHSQNSPLHPDGVEQSIDLDATETFSHDIVINLYEITGGAVGFLFNGSTTTITGLELTELNESMVATCFEPAADAGTNQNVDSGEVVTLSGSGTDDETSADDLNYSWTQTSGPTVTLSDNMARNPTFDTSELGLVVGGNSEVLEFQLTVVDEDDYASTNAATVQITVNPPPDTERPSVTLSDAPSTIAGGGEFDIVVRFSEEVEDVGTEDFEVVNGTVTSVVINGLGSAVYTATVRADQVNGQDLEIFFLENGAVDASDNGNTVSNTLTTVIASSDETEAVILDALKTNNINLINAQDSLTDFLNGNHAGAGALLVVEPGLATLSTRLALETGGWAKLQAIYSDVSGTETSYVHGTVGAHWFLADAILLGAMAQFDQSNEESALGDKTELKGWLLGPYIVGQTSGQNLYYEARLLAGKGDGHIEMASTGFTGNFDAERLLFKGKLEGSYETNWATLLPFLSYSHIKMTSKGFVDSGGVDIASQSVTTQQGELGLKARIPLGNGSSTLMPGISAAASNEDDDGHNNRGKFLLGFSKSLRTGSLGLDAFYDGIGQDRFESYGASLQINFSF